jgi:hypothetical protein
MGSMHNRKGSGSLGQPPRPKDIPRAADWGGFAYQWARPRFWDGRGKTGDPQQCALLKNTGGQTQTTTGKSTDMAQAYVTQGSVPRELHWGGGERGITHQALGGVRSACT